VTYKLEGAEKMGNGSEAATGPAAISLYESENNFPTPRMPLPAQALSIDNLFTNERVEFPFGDLAQTARQSLAACF
jgi:hypothetical protein